MEQKGAEVNWNKFLEKTKQCGIYKFALAAFILCNRLYGMKLPVEIRDIIRRTPISNKYIELLIPPIKDMGERYSYARKFIVLAPAA
ncbi:MAG: hypothetical protein E6344_13325 [Clostridium sp.]|nr:hypothetical protein [Clostridium sp.]MDU7084676.1 hypothetical protein [Clostridium sp.]